MMNRTNLKSLCLELIRRVHRKFRAPQPQPVVAVAVRSTPVPRKAPS